jgi:hypothetical protein
MLTGNLVITGIERLFMHGVTIHTAAQLKDYLKIYRNQ